MNTILTHQPSRVRSLVLSVLLLIGGAAVVPNTTVAQQNPEPDMADLAEGTMMCAGYLHESLDLFDDNTLHRKVSGYVTLLAGLGRLFGREAGVRQRDLEDATAFGQARARQWQSSDPELFQHQFASCLAMGEIAEREWMAMNSGPYHPTAETTPLHWISPLRGALL